MTEKKNKPHACVRCRKRHIKCPGGDPCAKCQSANAACERVENDRKVMVSVKYLQRLHEEIAALKKAKKAKVSDSGGAKFSKLSLSAAGTSVPAGAATTGSSGGGNTISDTTISDTIISDTSISDTVITSATTAAVTTTTPAVTESPMVSAAKARETSLEVIPPFVDRQRRLVSSKTGEKFYVGSSSMTLFGLEVESMVPDNVLRGNLQQNGEMNADETLSTILEREGNAYKIYLGKTETRPGMLVKFAMPSYSYAMLLIDTFITYNDGCFYFFNEGLVKESLKKTYDNGLGTARKEYAAAQDSVLETINFCKLLLIFAIGEMYLGKSNDINGQKSVHPRLPGSGFFQQASELFTGLFSSGAVDNVARDGGVEVVLLYAFYLQVADCTVASYFYFGVALRASLILGMHVDVEKDSLTRFELEHRRRLWWTVYMFERMLSSKAGLPLSLSDDSVSSELPQDFDMSSPPAGCEHYIFPDAAYIRSCVTIVQINALILQSLYQREPTTNILPVIAELMTKLFQWKESLPQFLKPNFQEKELRISRLVTNIMTEYFQGINLAVRPLLFCLTTKQIRAHKTSDVYIDLTKYSESVITLLNASFQGSINTIRSLWALMPENMVALFGYMDREYLFTSAATLILFNTAFGVHEATREHLDHALCIFTKMRNLGNNPAELRRAQLLRLAKTLNFSGRMDTLLVKFDNDEDYEYLQPAGESTKRNAATQRSINREKRRKVNNNRFVFQVKKNEEAAVSAARTTSRTGPVGESEGIASVLDSLLKNPQEIYSPFETNDVDNELWDEITNQPKWLNDVSEEFSQLLHWDVEE